MTTQPVPDVKITPAEVRRVVMSSFIGTALEWYDFFLYGTTSAIVFAPLFFPKGKDPVLSVLGAFLTFGIGFLARPLGAVIFGHFGDRLGRRNTLIWTISIMGAVTALMGVLPDYHTAGLVAPILLTLLRIAQGIATGGEWGGATLMALEYAPPERKGLYASIVQMGSPVGNLLSTGAVAVIAPLAGAGFLQWGWRIPYFLSVVLIGVAVWMRLRVHETPAFQQLAEAHDVQKLPLWELLKTAWLRVIVATFTYLFGVAGFFVMTTYAIQYVTGVLKLDKQIVLNAMLIGAAVELVTIFIGGLLSRRFGANRVVIWGYVLALLVSVPFFVMIDTKSVLMINLAYAVGFGFAYLSYGPVGAMMNKLFPTKINYSALAVSANLAAVISGAMPFMVTWINTVSNNSVWGPTGTLAVLAVLSLIAAVVADRLIKRDQAAGIERGTGLR